MTQTNQITPLNVLYLSNWVGNPYMDLLAKNLAGQKVRVTEQFRQLFFWPQLLTEPQPKILHLQTLHYIFVSRQPLYFWLKFLIFIAQLYGLKALGVRTIWTVHEWKDKNSEGQHDLSSRKAKILGRALDGVITHCQSTRQEMIQALGLGNHPKKVFVIPHGNYIGHYTNSMGQTEAR
ncbi:MAG: glycosyltransferase family 4 protein, partial [Cyanobacteria bacterium J06555_13]